MKHLFKVEYRLKTDRLIKKEEAIEHKTINVIDISPIGENVIKAIKQNLKTNQQILEICNIKYAGKIAFVKVENENK